MSATHFHFDSPLTVPTVRPRRGTTAGAVPVRQDFQPGVMAAMVRQIAGGTWIDQGPRSVAEEIRRITSAVRVVLATCDNGTGPNAIIGVSGLAEKSWSPDFEQAAVAAAGEACSVISPPTADLTAPFLQKFIALNQAQNGLAFRLLNPEGTFALLVIGVTDEAHWHAQIQTELPWLTNILQFWAAAERGSRLPKKVGWLRRLKSKAGRVTIAISVATAALLCVPFPYHVAGNVTIEPAVRTIHSAPFAGRLERTLVEPGDIVTPGQILATLDPRDLQVELSAAEAEEREVAARHQGALAGRQGNTSLVTKLELEQVQFKLQTLRNRQEQLAIKSALAGVVVRGDLRRLEGAPLSAGQTLLEIASLDDLLAEVAIPEALIDHVREEMPVEIRLDAFPYRSWPGTIARIHPRAELQHNDSVYIAEVRLAGETTALRPGMNGRASITTAKHPLAWNLFYRPLASLMEFAGW